MFDVNFRLFTSLFPPVSHRQIWRSECNNFKVLTFELVLPHSKMSSTEILVDVTPEPSPPGAKTTPTASGEGYTEVPGSSAAGSSAVKATTSGVEDILVDTEQIPSYQNQTAADIESGRARMDSVGSYGSGGSDEALLPDVGYKQGAVGPTSPRRGNRENLPLLGGRRGEYHRHSSYEEIEADHNVFPGRQKFGYPKFS